MDFLSDSDSDEVAVEREALMDLSDELCRAHALKLRPVGSGVLSFHTGIEEAMLLYVERVAVSGDPSSVLLAVDNFCYSRHWMMHVGDIKGKILDTALKDSQKRNEMISSCCAVELGSYCGYSALRIAQNLNNGELLYSIDIDDRCRKWTQRLLRKAGLLERVVVARNIDDVVSEIKLFGKVIIFLFIDHAKEKYVEDLIKFENSGVMQSPGCTVLADNILSFNVPLNEYIAHVSGNIEKYSGYQLHVSTVEYSSASSTIVDVEEAKATVVNLVCDKSRCQVVEKQIDPSLLSCDDTVLASDSTMKDAMAIAILN